MADRDPIPVADDEGVDTEYQGNAEQEEAQISEETVSKAEAAELDESNIIQGGTRAAKAKADPLKQERAIDADVDAASREDEQS